MRTFVFTHGAKHNLTPKRSVILLVPMRSKTPCSTAGEFIEKELSSIFRNASFTCWMVEMDELK